MRWRHPNTTAKVSVKILSAVKYITVTDLGDVVADCIVGIFHAVFDLLHQRDDDRRSVFFIVVVRILHRHAELRII